MFRGQGAMAEHSPTRASLLIRLRRPADEAAWREFDAAYSELIVRYCRRLGLQLADAEDVRQLVLTWLEGLGYQTTAAEDGPAALAQLQGGKHFDLLLTDVVLPNGMRGPDIAQATQKLLPDIKVLYMSGYASNSLSEQTGIPIGIHLLQKPFRRQALAQKLRELLDQ